MHFFASDIVYIHASQSANEEQSACFFSAHSIQPSRLRDQYGCDGGEGSSDETRMFVSEGSDMECCFVSFHADVIDYMSSHRPMGAGGGGTGAAPDCRSSFEKENSQPGKNIQ